MTIALSLKRRGFTLAELMVAMGITVLLLTMLITVTGVALDGWRISRNKVRAARQAKAALDQISRDFESMVVRGGNGFEWFYAESEGDAPGPQDTKSPNAARLVFFTAATDRYDGKVGSAADLGGDVSAVGYRLFYKDPITDKDGTPYDVFALYRILVDPELKNNPDIPGEGTFADLLAKEDLEKAFRPYENHIDKSRNFVCENIFEMSIVFLIEYTEVQENNTLERKLARVPILSTSQAQAAVKEFRLTGKGIKADGSDKEDYARGRIVAVDVTVSVLTDNAITTLRKAQFTQTKLEEYLAKNSYRYSKTVLLPQP